MAARVRLPSQDQVLTVLAERHLADFIRQAWPIIEPGPYLHNWHVDAVAHHLEAVTAGEIRRLLINMPPRCMKSLSVGVFWPAWVWIDHPELRWMFGSYDADLSIRDAVKTRDILQSPWYQARWGSRFSLKSDQNVKSRYDNDKGGFRLATSVGGGGTGEGGDVLVADDPLSAKQGESETARETAWIWWTRTMGSRMNNPRTGAKVVVMQRLHEKDVAGRLIDQGGYVHLCLPNEFEPRVQIEAPALDWQDPRTQPGELLWPERIGPDETAELKGPSGLGSYGYAGQMQQRPAPAGGGDYFKRASFPIVHAVPAGCRWVRAWDLAATESGPGRDPDWTVGLKVGWVPDGIFYVAAMERFRGTPGQVKSTVRNTSGQDGKACRIRLPQDPGQAGKSQAADFIRELAGFDVVVKPVSGSKEVRARPASAQAEHGNIRLLAGPWNEAFLAEVEVFPYGAHDDIVDALSDAIDELTSAKVRAPVRTIEDLRRAAAGQ